jgi:hypothetical protein
MIAKNRAVRHALLVFLVALVLTSLGLMYAWQAIEAPNSWNRSVPVVLLLPIAALSILFRRVFDDDLTSAAYRSLLILGPVAQYFYYFAVVSAIRWIASKIKSREREPESTAASSRANDRTRQ